MRHVAHESRLNAPDDKGFPARVHLEALVRRGKKPASVLVGPPLPESLEYLLAWYEDLARGCSEGVNGRRVTWVDVDAWASRTGVVLTALEATALLDIDLVARHPDALAEEAA